MVSYRLIHSPTQITALQAVTIYADFFETATRGQHAIVIDPSWRIDSPTRNDILNNFTVRSPYYAGGASYSSPIVGVSSTMNAHIVDLVSDGRRSCD